MNRREMIKMAGTAAVGATVLGVPMNLNAQEPGERRRRKLMVIGAHPDDPETCAGGTMCLFAEAGHEVVCVYLTRGEAGIEGMGPDEAAAIRVKECTRACEITGARHIFREARHRHHPLAHRLAPRPCGMRHAGARCLAKGGTHLHTLLLRGHERHTIADVPPHSLGQHRVGTRAQASGLQLPCEPAHGRHLSVARPHGKIPRAGMSLRGRRGIRHPHHRAPHPAVDCSKRPFTTRLVQIGQTENSTVFYFDMVNNRD